MSPHGWIVTALDIIPAIFTIIGNFIFFVTLWKTNSLHTPSNILLGFLSIIDLMVGLICQPLFLATIFRTDRPCCTQEMLAYNFVFILTCGNSYLCIALITGDRAFAIFYPFKYRAVASCKKFSSIAGITFLISTIYAVLEHLLYTKCKTAFILFKTTCQLMTLSLVSIVYLLIYRAVRRQNNKAAITSTVKGKARRTSRTEQHRTKMVALILFTFAFCTVPYTIFGFNMYLFYIGRSKFINGFGAWANFLFLLNSAINPLIYFISRTDIRAAARRLLSGASSSVFQLQASLMQRDAKNASKYHATFNALSDEVAVIENIWREQPTSNK